MKQRRPKSAERTTFTAGFVLNYGVVNRLELVFDAPRGPLCGEAVDL